MKIQAPKTFALSTLALTIIAVGASTSSHAVYNLYKKDGLTLDINGQIDMQATKNDRKHTLEQDATEYVLCQNCKYTSDDTQPNGWYWDSNGANTYGDVYIAQPVAKGRVFSDTDKQTRLGQTHGVSYVDIRGSQTLPNDWRVTGNVGLGYTNDRNLYLSNSSLSFDKKNLGAISLGRQYLHTGYVNRTGTDTPLDIFSTSSVRLDYTGIKGLHTSAYYSFAGSNDVRKADNDKITSGFGASLSYLHPIANNQSVRLAAGYTQSKFNTATDLTHVNNTLNRYPTKAQGIAGSVEYRINDLLVAADIGRKNETMPSASWLGKVKTNYLGAKVAYDINPVFQVSAGYGVKKSQKDLKDGAPNLFTQGNEWYDASAWNTAVYSFVAPTEQYLFSKVDTQEAYVQADYRIRPNVRLYGRFDNEVVKNKLDNQVFSKINDKNYRAGVVFTF